MGTAAANQPEHEVNIVLPELHISEIILTQPIGRVRAFPTVHRVTHTPDSVFPAPYFGVFKLNHAHTPLILAATISAVCVYRTVGYSVQALP